MLQFKPFFGEIDDKDKYAFRELFFERLGMNCIKIYLPGEKFGNGDIKVETDYCQWFNRFVSDKLRNDNLSEYKEDYDKFVSEFINKVNECGGNITKDIKKQLMFDDELLNKTISQKNQTKLTDKNKNKIGQSEKFNLEIKTIHSTKPGEKGEKLKNGNLKSNNKFENTKLNELNKEQNDEQDNTINVKTNTNNEGESKAKPTSPIKKITSSTDNQSNNTLEPKQKIDTAIDHSERENIQDQDSKTNFIPTIKISYPKLIAKIVLYALAVIALAVFIFSAIKVFWFLAILSILLCLVFTFIALKIKHKTTEEKPDQISTGYLNYQPEITGQYKNNGLNLNQIPKTTQKTGEKDKNNYFFSPS